MRSALLFVVLLVLGLGVFANALGGPFHFDDHHAVEYNPHIRSLTEVPAFYVDPATFSSRTRGYMYRPLLLTSLALDHALWGRWAPGFRATNLLLHVLMATLFAGWARRLGGGAGLPAGILFLVHPAHSEAVDYISSRSDVGVALLYTAAFLVWWAPGAAPRRSRLGLLAYAGALLSKSVAVTLPVLVFLARATWQGWRAALRPLRFWWQVAALTAAYLAILAATRFLQTSVHKLPRPWATEVWTQVKAVAYYAWLYVSPVHLSVDHPFEVARSPWAAPVLLASSLVLSLAWLAWRGRGGAPAFGLLWFAVTLSPYLLIPLNILVAERRTYTAGCGLLLVVIWAWSRAARRWRLRPLAVAFGVVLAVLTVERNRVWASEIDLWRDAVVKNPAGARARVNLALAYRRAGAADSARVQLRRGLSLNPGLAEGWVVLGELRLDGGDVDGAQAAFERAAALDPMMAGVHHDLGNVAIARGRAAEAVDHYRRALNLDPGFAEARNNLGQALEARGELAAACGQYEQAVADSALWVHTDDPVGGAWYNLGSCAERLGRRDRARQAYTRAWQLLSGRPEYAAFAERARARAAAIAGEGRER